jgi:hypothetical protein
MKRLKLAVGLLGVAFPVEGAVSADMVLAHGFFSISSDSPTNIFAMLRATSVEITIEPVPSPSTDQDMIMPQGFLASSFVCATPTLI